MKKKFLGLIAIVAIAVAIAFNVNIRTTESGLSDMNLRNINALADVPTKPKDCPSGTVLCAWIKTSDGSVTYYEP